MEVYFDNSATTRPYDEVIDAVVNAMKTDYGNPSSLHLKGLDAEHLVKKSTESVCKALKCLPVVLSLTTWLLLVLFLQRKEQESI